MTEIRGHGYHNGPMRLPFSLFARLNATHRCDFLSGRDEESIGEEEGENAPKNAFYSAWLASSELNDRSARARR